MVCIHGCTILTGNPKDSPLQARCGCTQVDLVRQLSLQKIKLQRSTTRERNRRIRYCYNSHVSAAIYIISSGTRKTVDRWVFLCEPELQSGMGVNSSVQKIEKDRWPCGENLVRVLSNLAVS